MKYLSLAIIFTIALLFANKELNWVSYWLFKLAVVSPGIRAIDGTREEFQKAMKEDAIVMDRIVERLKELGGFTPEISKMLGWGKP